MLDCCRPNAYTIPSMTITKPKYGSFILCWLLLGLPGLYLGPSCTVQITPCQALCLGLIIRQCDIIYAHVVGHPHKLYFAYLELLLLRQMAPSLVTLGVVTVLICVQDGILRWCNKCGPHTTPDFVLHKTNELLEFFMSHPSSESYTAGLLQW